MGQEWKGPDRQVNGSEIIAEHSVAIEHILGPICPAGKGSRVRERGEVGREGGSLRQQERGRLGRSVEGGAWRKNGIKTRRQGMERRSREKKERGRQVKRARACNQGERVREEKVRAK